MSEKGEFYSCLCVGDAAVIGGAIERGLVAGGGAGSGVGQKGPSD